MALLPKLIIWCISFPVSLLVLTIFAVFEYISLVFNMPTDIWNVISGEYDEKEKA